MNWFGRGVLVLILGCGISCAGYAYWNSKKKPASAYRTAPLKRGELISTISATGTLEPEEVIDVGAQVAGQIMEFGKDAKVDKPVDYRSTVKEGAVLAKIDDTVYQAALQSAEAQRDQTIAGILKAQADLKQMHAKEIQAERDWNRAQQAEKSGQGVLAQADLDAYKATYDAAVATVALGEASVTVAEKQQTQAEASLRMAQRNLEYCTIKSPVDGTIIDRRVNKGQTVVASLNAPSLFLIAKDLTKMQVWASVNEADISNIHDGQRVTFTVDAIPGRTFEGSVNKVRLNATMNQNVVTYTVEITTQNKDLALLPYLTANVLFEVARKNDTLLAPNAALRWTPATEELIAPESRSALAAHGTRVQGPTDPTEAPKPKKQDHQHHGFIWVEDGNYVKPIRVATGLTDGTNTEVVPDQKDTADLKEGLAVITGEANPDENSGDVSNPFVPKFKAQTLILEPIFVSRELARAPSPIKQTSMPAIDPTKFILPSQAGGIDQYAFTDGPARNTRALCVNTGAGLRYRILPDRGFDIDQAFLNQHSLPFLTYNGVTAPSRAFDKGLDWLRSFPGGLLTSCGPFNTGGPVNDAGDDLGLHGPHSNTGATIESVIQPDPHAGQIGMSVTGTVKYATFYGPNVQLRRTIRSTLGSNKISVTDEFFNAGNRDVPHAWLLHINFGYPLIDAGSEFCYSATKIDALDDESARQQFRQGNDYKKVPAPMDSHRGPTSFVAYLYPKSENDRATVGVVNHNLNLGVAIRYNTKEFPRCAHWQHYGPGEYVAALEPANGGVEDRAKDRANGWLDTLPAGGRKKYQYEIEAITEDAALKNLLALNARQ